MIGKTQRRAVQHRYPCLLFGKLLPHAVVLLCRPERMVCRKMQAQKRLSQPERRLRAGIALHKRHELPVKAKRRNALKPEILPRQKLQQGAGGNPPCQPRISLCIFQKHISVKSARRRIPVNIAAPPHIRKAIPVKKFRIGFHQRIGMRFKLPRNIRHVLIAVPQIPDRRIDVERPAGIIIEAVAVPVPAVPRVKIQHRLCVLQHDPLVHRIAFHM